MIFGAKLHGSKKCLTVSANLVMLRISFHILLYILPFHFGILICLPYDILELGLADIVDQHGVHKPENINIKIKIYHFENMG